MTNGSYSFIHSFRNIQLRSALPATVHTDSSDNIWIYLFRKYTPTMDANIHSMHYAHNHGMCVFVWGSWF